MLSVFTSNITQTGFQKKTIIKINNHVEKVIRIFSFEIYKLAYDRQSKF